MNDCPVNTQPRISDLKKRIIGIFVVEKLIALLKYVQAMLSILRILNAAITVFCPGNMNNPAVVGN